MSYWSPCLALIETRPLPADQLFDLAKDLAFQSNSGFQRTSLSFEVSGVDLTHLEKIMDQQVGKAVDCAINCAHRERIGKLEQEGHKLAEVGKSTLASERFIEIAGICCGCRINCIRAW